MRDIITDIKIVDEITLVTLNNISSDIEVITSFFDSLDEQKINVDMISQTAPLGNTVNLSFTIHDKDLPKLLTITSKYKNCQTLVNSGNSKIIFYGEGMKTASGVAAFVFGLFTKAKTNIKVVTTSECEISCLAESVNLIALKEIIKSSLNISL